MVNMTILFWRIDAHTMDFEYQYLQVVIVNFLNYIIFKFIKSTLLVGNNGIQNL